MSNLFSKRRRMEKAYLLRMAKQDTSYTDQHKVDMWWTQDKVNAKRINETIDSIDRRWDLIDASTDDFKYTPELRKRLDAE